MIRTKPTALITALVLAASACRSAPDRMWEREVAQAKLMFEHGNPQAARDYLLQLPAKLSPGKHPTSRAEFERLRQIAIIEQRVGLLEESDRHWKECVIACERDHDASRTASAQVGRFNVLYKLKRLREAQNCLDQARKYMDRFHERSLEPFILHDEGILLIQSRHFEESLAPLNLSLVGFEQLNRPQQAANVRVTEAWSLYLMGRYDDAEKQYLAAQKAASPEDQHLCLGHLGNIAEQRRNFRQAASYAHQASLIAEKVNRNYYATWLTNEATFLIELGEIQKANEQNEKALTVASAHSNPDVLEQAQVNRARIDRAHGQAADAIAQLEAVGSRANHNAATLDAYAQLVELYLANNDTNRSRAAYEQGLHLVNEQRDELQDIENKFFFEASAIRLNQTYIQALMARGKTQEAFEAAEASRAVMLQEGLGLRNTAGFAPHLKNYQRAAKQTGSAYLTCWIAPERSYLWVVTASKFRWYPLLGEAELQARVDRFQQLIQDGKSSDREGAEIFQILVAPALPQLAQAKRIVVSPDGPLYGINMETLRQGSTSAPYWIESATISTAPSLSIMLSKSVAAAPNGGVLSIGDAEEWDPNFPHLSNSREELDSVESHFPIGQRTRLAKEHATSSDYQHQELSRYRYIHFATHAAANRQAPLESAIILSKRNDAGMLTARDVLQQQVRAELVSISACRSAGGKTYAGEGLVGFAWAFLHAGAHSVVAGLWDISDHSSPLLMDKLYAGLAKGKPAAEALRDAKLELLRSDKYKDPYYWGPFLLYQGAGSK